MVGAQIRSRKRSTAIPGAETDAEHNLTCLHEQLGQIELRRGFQGEKAHQAELEGSEGRRGQEKAGAEQKKQQASWWGRKRGRKPQPFFSQRFI